MLLRQKLRVLAMALVFFALAAGPVFAITIDINYDYDTSAFFGASNPQGLAGGLQAQAALQSAADFFSTILNDTFSSIQTPPQYHSAFFDGQVTWQWTMNFPHPATGSSVVLTDPTVAADHYLIYAGARGLSGSTAGFGGPGGTSWSSNPSGGFTQQEIDEIDVINTAFGNAVEHRGEPTGFASWGGAITFDNDGSTTWHFNHTAAPSGNVVDFYSVAIHELGHALGFGASTDWNSLIGGSTFTGDNAKALNGGRPVPLAPGLAHWAAGTSSVVYGTATSQEAAMDPDVLNGTRKLFTELDAAALKDIGWEVIPLPGVPGDYNNNGVVDAADYALWRDKLGQSVTLPNDTTPGTVNAADYTVWKTNFGKTTGSATFLDAPFAVPEPSTLIILLLGSIASEHPRRKRCG